MQNKYNCPVDATISKIGGKYKAVILYHLGNNTLRYNQIHKKIPAITDKMLAQQLRELENDNLIIKKIYPVIPPKTEYSLSGQDTDSFIGLYVRMGATIYARLRFIKIT